MKKTNFENSMVEKINSVLEFVLDSPYSDFYRSWLEGSGIRRIESYKQFQKIPKLTKDVILKTSLKKRIFVPIEKVLNYNFSSGTTGSKNILAMPHLKKSPGGIKSKAVLDFGSIKAADLKIKKIMVLWPVYSGSFRKNLSIEKGSAVPVPGDIDNLERSALMARALNIDAISSTPTTLGLFIERLKDVSFELRKIKWVSLGGEFCTKQKFQYFKKTLPNAFISFKFSSSEMGFRGYRCQYLAKENPSLFHPVPKNLIEIECDDDDSEEGEILHTSLEQKAFPLIRYATGDIGRLTEKNCPCGNGLLLEVLGRKKSDILKFSGVILRIEAIEKALSKVENFRYSPYEMHVGEENVGGKLKPKLKIILQPDKKHAADIDNSRIKEMVAEKISSGLFLSSKSTLKDLVEQGIFLPLEVDFVGSFPNSTVKSKKIISHLE